MLSVDAQKAAAPQLDDINSYIAEMTKKFISGDEPLTNFDNYIDQLQKMGMDDLIAAYQEFTDLVTEAKAITDNMDARYAAFAKAEACFIGHVFTIPCSYEVAWELTKVNNYSKVYSMYGMQAYRYVDWEAQTEPYTTEEMAALAAAYAAE